MEELAGRAAEGIDGQVAGDDHGDGIEDRSVHVLRRQQDYFIDIDGLPLAQGEFAEDVLHHNYGAVNDDAEVYGANREQVSGNVVRVQDDEGKQQRQRDRESHDNGGANADQKENQHDQHQHHAAQQVVLHRVSGQIHQPAAVVEGKNLHVLGENLLVELPGLFLHAFEHGLRLLAAAHEDDAFDRIIVALEAELAQAGRVADHDLADVLDANGRTFVTAHHDVADIRGIAHQAQAAHVVELAALGINAAAGVAVVGSQRIHHLGHGEVVGVNLCRIQEHLILHGSATEAGIVGDTRHRLVGSFYYPVLNGFQFLRAAVGALQHVAINQAAGAEQ